MYFVMNDYEVTDVGTIGLYIDELPMSLGHYDSFRVTCVETMDCVICRTMPTDTSTKTPTMRFDVGDRESCQFVVEYMMIGDEDYTYIGTFILYCVANPTIRYKGMTIESGVDGKGDFYISLPKGNGKEITLPFRDIKIEKG